LNNERAALIGWPLGVAAVKDGVTELSTDF